MVPFPVAHHLHVLDVVPAVVGSHVVLLAALDPLDGLPKPFGQHGDDDFIYVGTDLTAEAAVHVGGDRPQSVLRVSCGQCRGQPHQMGHLGRGPNCKVVCALVVIGEHPTGLDGVRNQALVDDLLANNYLGIPRRRFDVATTDSPLPGDVVGRLFVDTWHTSLCGFLRIHHHRQGLVVHIHHPSGVYTAVAGSSATTAATASPMNLAVSKAIGAWVTCF